MAYEPDAPARAALAGASGSWRPQTPATPDDNPPPPAGPPPIPPTHPEPPLPTARALLLSNPLPLSARGPLVAGPTKTAVFVALPFVGLWNSIAGPATLRVVGDSLHEHRRTMAFSLQSIQKRVSSLLANFISG